MRKIFFTILALCIATLANFAIGNEFKNMLLNIDFDKIGENCYKINLETQVPYADEIKIVKKSDYNYYILLSETYAKMAVNNINSDIVSASVSLYPYAEQDSSNGYAKITLNTSKPLDFTVSLSAKSASKFPVMDLVKIAQLNQMYDKYNTTVKTTQTVVAQKSSTPAAVQKPAESQKIAQKTTAPVAVPQKSTTPAITPTEVQKPLQLDKIPSILAQGTPETRVDIKPTTAPKQAATVAKPLPAPKIETLQIKTTPQPAKVQSKPAAAAKTPQPQAAKPVQPAKTVPKPVAQPVKPTTTAVQPVEPATPIAKPVQPVIVPEVIQQAPIEPTIVEAPQQVPTLPEILAPKTKISLAEAYEKYPIQVIVLVCAFLAFLIGVFQLLSARTRKRPKPEESIGLGARPLYSAQEPSGEIFEEILDENIYANMPDFIDEVVEEAAPTYHQELETAVPDFLEDFSEELGNIEDETPVIELAKDEEQIPFESAPEPFVTGPLAIEEDFSIDFDKLETDVEIFIEKDEQGIESLVEEKQSPAEPKEEKPVETKEAKLAEPKEVKPLKSVTTSPIKPAEEPKPRPVSNVAKILSSAQVENDRGFYLADFKGVKSLVAYVMDNVFVIHSFKDSKIQNPQIDFRLSETNKQGDFYLVRVGDTKLLVKSEKEKMSLVDVA